MEAKLKDLFLNVSKQKIGHAYLIGNVSYENIKIDLDFVISNYIFEDDSSIDNNPDLFLVTPENLLITKDQIKLLQENIQNTSQYHNKKVYIISECEKMNAYAANSLLKTLEEPNNNIYAFLITSNMSKVMQTIKSRCQILFVSTQNKNEDEEDNESKDIVFKLIGLIEEKKENCIAYYEQVIKKNIEKKDLKKMLTSVEYFYRDCINKKLNRDLEYFIDFSDEISKISNTNDLKKLTSKLLIVDNAINNMEFNLNTYLLIDKLIIDFGRC